MTATTGEQGSTTLLERFEQLEAIWPGGEVPNVARLGTTRVSPALPTRERTDIASRGSALARRHRKPLIVGVVVAGLLAWAFFGIAPAIGEGIAEARRHAYLESLDSIDGSLGNARTALGFATAEDAATLSDTVGPLAEFTSVTQSGSELAAEPLPSTPPLVPRSPVEELAPLQDRVLGVAQRSDSLAQSINAVVSYRLLLEGAFRLPELPTEATAVEVDQLSGEISFSLAETTDIVLRLPAHEFLQRHAAETTALLEELEIWRGEYLQALRTADIDAATTLVGEATSGVATWHEDLNAPLTEFESWASKELDEIRVLVLE